MYWSGQNYTQEDKLNGIAIIQVRDDEALNWEQSNGMGRESFEII